MGLMSCCLLLCRAEMLELNSSSSIRSLLIPDLMSTCSESPLPACLPLILTGCYYFPFHIEENLKLQTRGSEPSLQHLAAISSKSTF